MNLYTQAFGDELDAGALLGSARWSYIEERRVPEAALVSMDGMVFHAEAGRAAVAYAQYCLLSSQMELFFP